MTPARTSRTGCTARGTTPPRMLTRHRIAEVLYAGVGAGILEPVPPSRVDDTVDRVLAAMSDGRLRPRMLAAARPAV